MTVPNNAAAFAVGSGAIQPTGTSKSEESSTIRMESKIDEDMMDALQDANIAAELLQLDVDDADISTLMRLYYLHFFPFKRMYRWLSYSNSQPNYFCHREFSFTLRDFNNSEIYLRFSSFANKKELKEDILKKNPEKIDIGPVYSSKPKFKNSLRPGVFKPVERELVFDIDMTDYDEVRTCCKGAAICMKCWKFIVIAMKIIHRVLTEDFGFQHILWVYSGRRGVHCWIADERARKLSEECRKAIVGYMEVIKGGEQKSRKVILPSTLHPSLQYAQTVIKSYFSPVILQEQDLLMDSAGETRMLDCIPNEDVRDAIARRWAGCSSSDDKWAVLVEEIENNLASKTKDRRLIMCATELKFQCIYPRLDAQVSMHLNHLLKAPFCVHPKTGRVCVPIRVSNLEKFNPLEVPTAASLVKELNEFDRANPNAKDENGKPLSSWKKTSMKEAISIFDEFLLGLENEARQKMVAKRVIEDMKLNF